MAPTGKKGRFDFPKARGSTDRMEFTVSQYSQKRLDQYLSERFTGYSRTFLQSLIKNGKILIGGRTVKPSYTVCRGDDVTILLDTPSGRQAEDLPLEVILEDEHILVINKTAGMVVHPARGNLSGTIFNGLMHRYREMIAADPDFHLGSVHRLDENTSGVMVYGRNLAASRHLTNQFEHRKVNKEYLLVVHGHPDFTEREVAESLGPDPADRFRIIVNPPGAKSAKTLFRVFSQSDQGAVLCAFPRTGRGHQIRVHAQFLGHPIVGDTLYDGRTITPEGDPLIERQALHAMRLGFTHPGSEQATQFTASVPGDMRRLAERMKLDLPEK